MRTLCGGMALALALLACGSRPGRAPATDESGAPATPAAATPVTKATPETTAVTAGGALAPRPEAAPPASAAAESTQAGAGWTSTPGQRVRPGSPARLTAVRTSGLPGFDRVEFEFDGRVPGYRVALATGPVQACGSGEPVTLPGSAVLVVGFRGAAAHDDAGHATVAERDRRPGLPGLVALHLFCDFEGDVSWALALPRAMRFRVAEAVAPPRLTVDIQHPR